MADNRRSKNTRSVPDKKAGRHRPPKLDQQLPKNPTIREGKMLVSPTGKKRMI